MATMPDWVMLFALPGLKLDGKRAPREGITLGLEGIALVDAGDSRVADVRRWSGPADRFLSSFHDGNGGPITPSVAIARADWMASFNREVEPIVAFRNACALCCVLPCRAGGPSNAWAGWSWTDSFDFHPALLSMSGERLDIVTPAMKAIGIPLQDLSLNIDQSLARNDMGAFDTHLAARLGRLWKQRYIRGRHRRQSAQVFRSLEAAYNAASLTFKNYASLNEIGMDAVYWANATEVLAAPPTGEVSKWHCMELVGEFDWQFEPALRARRYRVRDGKKAGLPKHRSVSLPQKIFYLLYHARSKFVHGDTISESLLLPFGAKAPSLLSLASTIYRLALHAYLERSWPVAPSLEDRSSLDFLAYGAYEKHLLAAAGRQRWHY